MPTYITFDYETYKVPIYDSKGRLTNRSQFKPIILGYCIAEDDKIVERDVFRGDSCTDDFCKMLDERYFVKEKNETDVYCISYNGVNFDNCFITGSLFKHFRNDVMFSNTLSNAQTMKEIRFANISFVDFNRLYAGRLDDVCKSFGVKGKEQHILVDVKNISVQEYETNQSYKQELDSYCVQDCVCLMECYLKHKQIIMDEVGDEKCAHKFTSASLAISIFPYFIKEKLPSAKKCEDQDRQAYKGGFTAVFKYSNKSGKELFYYDINSMYPWAMRDGVMPMNYIKTVARPEDFNKFKPQNLYLIQSFEFPEINCYGKKTIPNLYDKKPILQDNKPIWRSGVEVMLAIKLGATIKVSQEIQFSESKTLFKDYVNHFYEKKKEAKLSGNSATEQFYKLMLNCLYGKMGQRDFNKNFVVKTCNLENVLTNMGGCMKKLDYMFSDDKQNWYYVESTQIDFDKYDHNKGRLIRLARQITATARSQLFDIMNRIGLDDMYYCDTDSVITSLPMHKMNEFDDLISSTELGKLKNELKDDDAITYFRAFAPKCYTYETKLGKSTRKAKGVPGNFVNQLNYAELAEDDGEGEQEIENTMFKKSLTVYQIFDNKKVLMRDPFPKFDIQEEETTKLYLSK